MKQIKDAKFDLRTTQDERAEIKRLLKELKPVTKMTQSKILIEALRVYKAILTEDIG